MEHMSVGSSGGDLFGCYEVVERISEPTGKPCCSESLVTWEVFDMATRLHGIYANEDILETEERAQIQRAVALAKRGPAEPDEVEGIVTWAAHARFHSIILEMILDGSLVVRLEAGTPVFHRSPAGGGTH